VHSDPGLPDKPNEIFVYFMLKQMPTGLRGLLIAGIFATSMGSLSAALNALATSYTRDWYQTRTDHGADDAQAVAVVRRFTYVFAVLITIVASATAFFVIKHPESRIIPIVLGIFGYTYGSLLGIFLLALLTKERGSDVGNCVGMLVGFGVVALLTGLPNQVLEFFSLPPVKILAEIPIIAFPWRIMIGACLTFAVAALFKTGKPAMLDISDKAAP
jgi:Na+/proline symporter